MTRYQDLPLRVKFYSLMTLLLLALLLSAAYFTYLRQERLILQFAVENARRYALEIIETREYISSVVRGEPEQNYALVPQVVATEVAKRVTRHSNYSVRQISLRYRNPGNRPDPFEAAQLKAFQTRPREYYTVVQRGEERYFRYLQPMVATASCLECHGSYQSAPEFIRRRFPPGHYSYNYRVGEVIGAVSVTIPVKELYAGLGTSLKLELFSRVLVFLIVVTVLGVVLRRQIIDPIKMVAESIVRVTRTGRFEEKLPQRSKDEVGLLIAAFNDMMEELNRKTRQSQEADQRYRRFIEMANSAVITFLKDGKIVISNQKAEELFGRSRADLLGVSVFALVSDPEALKERLAAGAGVREESFYQQVADQSGRVTAVDMVVSASGSEAEPMFTAILRERHGS